MRPLYLILFGQLIPTVSCRPYPYRPFGVKRSEPGDALFELIDDKPVFQSWHVDGFHRRTIGARNQGLATATNPYKTIPRWGPPPPSPIQEAERRLRTSRAARNPDMSDWVYNNSITAVLSCGIILVALSNCVLLIYRYVIRLAALNSPSIRFWKFVRQGNFIAKEDLAMGVVFAAFEFADLCWAIMFGVTSGLLCYGASFVWFIVMEYFAHHWRLGMERSKSAEIRIADARRWSGDISPR